MKLPISRSLLLATVLLMASAPFSLWRLAPVQAQTSPRWEYRVVKADRIVDRGGASEVKGLNQLGEAGWEAVGISDSWVLMKRAR